MQVGSYQFNPKILPTSLAIIGVIFLLNLGNWQINRADEKRLILDDIATKKIAIPLKLVELDKIEDKNYHHLTLKGLYDNQHYLLLDNRFYKSRVGFEVIQPLIMKNRVVLVNRGWIPLPEDRNNLPDIPVISGMLEVLGEVNIPTSTIVFRADELSAAKTWPQLVQSLKMEQLTTLYGELGLSIEPWILRQEVKEDPFYHREWIFVAMLPAKHISYAVTWFALALALIIIYIAAATNREEKKLGTDEV